MIADENKSKQQKQKQRGPVTKHRNVRLSR